MGNNPQNKQSYTQSLPSLPSQQKSTLYAEVERVREPLGARQSIDNIGGEEVQKEKAFLKEKVSEVKLKKVKEITGRSKQNEVQHEDIEDINIKVSKDA